MEFLNEEPKDNIDITIAKLEALKKLFDEKIEPFGQNSEFEELIEMAKSTKEIIENMKNCEAEDFDDYEYEEDDLPRHYYGEDGEILFEEV